MTTKQKLLIAALILLAGLIAAAYSSYPHLRYRYVVHNLKTCPPGDTIHWVRQLADLGQPAPTPPAIISDLQQRGLADSHTCTVAGNFALIVCTQPAKRIYLLYERQDTT